MQRCPICGYYSPSLVLHISHLRLVHSCDPSFQVSCDIGGCQEVFQTFSAFNSHVYRRHRVALGLEEDSGEVECSSHEPGPSRALEVIGERELLNPRDKDDQQGGESSYSPDIFASGQFTSRSDHLDYLKSNAEFFMTLSEGRMLSQVAVDDVIKGCRSICQQALSQVKQDVTRKLVDAQIDCSSITGLDVALSCVLGPFKKWIVHIFVRSSTRNTFITW